MEIPREQRWQIRKSNSALSTGYVAVPASGRAEGIPITRPKSVLMDVLGLVHWSAAGLVLFLLVSRLPGSDAPADAPWTAELIVEMALVVGASVAGLFLIYWSWELLRGHFGFPIVIGPPEMPLGRWEEKAPGEWVLRGMGGEEVCVARRGSWRDALRYWGHRRPWRFAAAGSTMEQEPGGKRPFPHSVKSVDLWIHVEEDSIRFDDFADERSPQSVLIAFCVAVFCLEISRSVF